MTPRFASKILRLDRERVEFWSKFPDCRLALLDGVYRLERDATPQDRRQPSPAPVPEDLARALIAAGMPVRRDGDLFGGGA